MNANSIIYIGFVILLFVVNTAAAYLYLTQGPGSGIVDQNGVMLPVLLVAFASFFSATMFLGVLSATADSMLQVDTTYHFY